MALRHQTSGTKPPRVSVIIPCWNAAVTLRETLKSVQAQSFCDWEAIIVDDGSTDETPAIIAEFSDHDPRFRALKTNRFGPSVARNIASLHHARGEILAFLDSDDLWTAQKLECSLAWLDSNPGFSGVYGQISFFRQEPSKPETHSKVYPRELAPLDFLRDNPVCTMSNLVLRCAAFCTIGGFNPDIIHNEDVELLVRMTAAGYRIGGIDRHLVCYRTSLNGLSTNLKLMRAGWHKALAALQTTGSALSPHEVAAADAGNLRYLARRALRTGAPGLEALRLVAAGINRSPRSFFNPLWRGSMTLAGAVAAPLLPLSIRSVLFSR